MGGGGINWMRTLGRKNIGREKKLSEKGIVHSIVK
jgi:hypothetical protein